MSATSNTSRRPRLTMPAGACDTHMHFYNARYPAAPTAPFFPPDAWIDDYRAMQQRVGLERVIVVQPTTYGFDNRCNLEAMAAFGDTARGVMIVDPATGDGELERLTGLGARGIRFHMLAGAVLPWDCLEQMAARVHAFGWHVQLQMMGHELPDRLDMLQRLPGDLVIDHIGRFEPPVPPEHDSVRALLRLLDTGRCWVKLSAPYTASRDGPPAYADVRDAARALVKAAPERMLWASNWPHPNRSHPYDEADLIDLLLDWADDDATRHRILADNPAALYGFTASNLAVADRRTAT